MICDTSFQYWVANDFGNNDATTQTWRLADNVPNKYEMSSGNTFTRPAAQPQYDRGHLVDANVMDNRTIAITDTYHRINMAPQARQFNRAGGAWRHIEKIVDCSRDITTLAVWGGVITLAALKAEIEFIPYFYRAESGQYSTHEWPVTGSQNLTCGGHTTTSS